MDLTKEQLAFIIKIQEEDIFHLLKILNKYREKLSLLQTDPTQYVRQMIESVSQN